MMSSLTSSAQGTFTISPFLKTSIIIIKKVTRCIRVCLYVCKKVSREAFKTSHQTKLGNWIHLSCVLELYNINSITLFSGQTGYITKGYHPIVLSIHTYALSVGLVFVQQ